MLRLPPTTIELGRLDVDDYERRKAGHRPKRAVHYAPRRAEDGPAFDPVDARVSYRKSHVKLEGDRPSLRSYSPNRGNSSSSSPEQITSISHEETAISDSQDEYGYVSVHAASESEETVVDTTRSSSPGKDDFHYGGFVDRRNQGDIPAHQTSSPFVPDAHSTPRNPEPHGRLQLRPRMPLPRSPLFLSHNASPSPEHPLTTGLSPRVASRVATHNTPNIIFSYPARRPRGTPRALRHQTNSFSFESSDRSSGAHQGRFSSPSADDDITRSSNGSNLLDDVRDTSLASSRITSGQSAVSFHDTTLYASTLESIQDNEHNPPHPSYNGNFIFSSPPLSMPAPFSASRRVSPPELLPSSPAGEYPISYPSTSPSRSSSSSPVRVSGTLDRSSAPTAVGLGQDIRSSPPSGRKLSPKNILRGAGRYISQTMSMQNLSQSPGPSRASAPPSLPSASRRFRHGRPVSLDLDVQTPSRVVRPVYNDGLPADSQPQTPDHLPEARHQSRYHPSYTAPVTRAAARRDRERAGYAADRRARNSLTTPVRQRRARSPPGLRSPGLLGLYGGRENGDEEEGWVEGVRLNNTEGRLWGARDDASDGRHLRETPEPEDWRPGHR